MSYVPKEVSIGFAHKAAQRFNTRRTRLEMHCGKEPTKGLNVAGILEASEVGMRARRCKQGDASKAMQLIDFWL